MAPKSRAKKVSQNLISKTKKPVTIQNNDKVDQILHEVQKDPACIETLLKTDYLHEELWKSFHSDVSINYILAIVYIINFSNDHQFNILREVTQDESKFSGLFYRIISILISDNSIDSQLITFISTLLNNMQIKLIRSLLGSLFSILIWDNLENKSTLLKDNQLESLFNSKLEQYNSKTGQEKEISYLSKNWFYKFVINTMTSPDGDDLKARIQLILDIVSFLPTRKFTNIVLKEVNFISGTFSTDSTSGSLKLLQYLIYYPLDDLTCEPVSSDDYRKLNNDNFGKLMNSCSQFGIVSFTMYDNLENLARSFETFSGCFESVNVDKLLEIAKTVGVSNLIRKDKNFVLSSLWYHCCFANTENLSSGQSLFSRLSELKARDDHLETLGYLDMKDYTTRTLKTIEQYIVKDLITHLDKVSKRLRPEKNSSGKYSFKGTSKFCVPLKQKVVVHKEVPNFFNDKPKQVQCEIILDFKGIDRDHEKEWSQTTLGDILYLVCLNNKARDLVPVTIKKVSHSKNREHRYLADVEKTSIFKSESFNCLLRGDEELSIKAQQYLALSDSALEKVVSLPFWISNMILKFGSPLDSKFDNLTDQPLYVKFPIDPSIAYKFADILTIEDGPSTKKRKTGRGKKKVEPENTDRPILLKVNPGNEKFQVLSNFHSLKESGKSNDQLSEIQIKSIIKGTLQGLTVLDGRINTGKATTISHLITTLYDNFPNRKTLLLTSTYQSKERILNQIKQQGIIPENLVYSVGENKSLIKEGYSEMLNKVEEFSKVLKLDGAFGNDSKSVLFFYEEHVSKEWTNFLTKLNEYGLSNDNLERFYPFGSLEIDKHKNVQDNLKVAIALYTEILQLCTSIQKDQLKDYFSNASSLNSIAYQNANLVAMTKTELLKPKNLQTVDFSNLIIMDADNFTDFDLVLSSSLQSEKSSFERITLAGNSDISLNSSILKSLIKSGVQPIKLDSQYEINESLTNISKGLEASALSSVPGLEKSIQFIDVSEGSEISRSSDQFQNVQEAEFTVCLFLYLKLKNYNVSEIAIVTKYKAQKLLIKEILKVKCTDNVFPDVYVLDELNSRKFKYVLFSLVRTKESTWSEADSRVVLNSVTDGLFTFGKALIYRETDIFSKILKIQNGQHKIGLLEDNKKKYKVVNIDSLDDFWSYINEFHSKMEE